MLYICKKCTIELQNKTWQIDNQFLYFELVALLDKAITIPVQIKLKLPICVQCEGKGTECHIPPPFP